MANRITVSICGEEYTLMAEENPTYMQKVAALVDAKMSEMMRVGRVSRMDAAVLAAANMADEMLVLIAVFSTLGGNVLGWMYRRAVPKK